MLSFFGLLSMSMLSLQPELALKSMETVLQLKVGLYAISMMSLQMQH